MTRLFYWHGRDTPDLYAVSLFKISGLMILGFVGSYLIVRVKQDMVFFDLWNWIYTLVILAAFLSSSMRRLRDVGRGAAFLVIFAVPVLGLCLFVYLLFAKSGHAQRQSQRL